MDERLVSTSQRIELSRRALVGGALAGGAAIFTPAAALASNPGEWRLAFRNVHTNENFDAVFARGGRYVPQGLAELNHGLRDWRTGEITTMDRRLFALLVRLKDTLGMDGARKIELISGYRSSHTNAALKAEGGAHSGVASKSQHMLGKATDLAVPGVRLDNVRGAAMSLKGGGVGFYPKDGFVHVDTGAVRHW